MSRYYLHVNVESKLFPDTEAKITENLKRHGFLRKAKLHNGDVLPTVPWLYIGDADDDSIVESIGKELHEVTGKELFLLISPGDHTFGWHSPGSLRGIEHLDPDIP